ncbi:basic proline-rich protein-like [Choloepus didactylus]|uniref:basic proline-rich protein-like n=1 Tax=Choloepus didactylus TaxID=27675 RepID=UPI0018A00867|nr:basic proline-rich protein-like [Choloepus didactylus]
MPLAPLAPQSRQSAAPCARGQPGPFGLWVTVLPPPAANLGHCVAAAPRPPNSTAVGASRSPPPILPRPPVGKERPGQGPCQSRIKPELGLLPTVPDHVRGGGTPSPGFQDRCGAPMEALIISPNQPGPGGCPSPPRTPAPAPPRAGGDARPGLQGHLPGSLLPLTPLVDPAPSTLHARLLWGPRPPRSGGVGDEEKHWALEMDTDSAHYQTGSDGETEAPRSEAAAWGHPAEAKMNSVAGPPWGNPRAPGDPGL